VHSSNRTTLVPLKLARVLALLAGLLLFARPLAASTLPELAAGATPSVVLITLYDSAGRKEAAGTGFFISTSGRLVTNHHVVEDSAKATATLSDGRVVPILGLLADDPDHDLAGLQAEGGGYAPLSLAEPGSIRAGDEVVVIGSPLGLSAAISTGIVAAVRDHGLSKENGFEKEEGTRAWGLQITAAISRGSSGSPILDAKGEVVGVAVGLLATGENLNFAIPVEFVRTILKTVPEHAIPKSIAGESDALRNLLISVGMIVFPALGYLFWSRSRKGPKDARRLSS
jgi:serine protease Do